MLTYFGKYKVFIISSLLAGYLAGTFQGPLQEGLHQVSHLIQFMLTPPPEQNFYTHHQHNHQVGQVHDHEHAALSFLSTLLDRFSNDHLPIENQKKNDQKKSPEIFGIARPIAFFAFTYRTWPHYYAYPVLSFYPSISTPPPKA